MEQRRFEGLFEGLWPVMLTAFGDDGSLDLPGADALVDFYLESGSRGLFAVCQSSEMYDLSDDERIALASRIVRYADGRVPVVATATFGGPIEAQAAMVRRMADTGVGAVIVLPNQLCAEDENEDTLRERLLQLITATEPIPLGLYECPLPYHRVLSPDFVTWVVSTARFRYIKDTSRDPALFGPKIAAVRESGLALFNAAPASALASLRLGAAGLSPVAANLYPDLFAWLCEHAKDRRADWLQVRLAMMEAGVRPKYPQSAKRFLADRCGVRIGHYSRVAQYDWDNYDQLNHAAMATMMHETRAALGLTD